MHICVGNLTIIGSDNGLSPGQRQAIIWTNAGILFSGPLGTNFSEILIEIITFSFRKMHLKVSSAKWRPCCLGLNVLKMNCVVISLNCIPSSFLAGYKKLKMDKLNEDLNPGLALIADWILSSGNTTLSVDMLISCLEQMHREDIVEIIQKGQGEQHIL